MSTALRIVAIVCFSLAALGVPGFGGVSLVPAGLAFWAGSTLT